MNRTDQTSPSQIAPLPEPLSPDLPTIEQLVSLCLPDYLRIVEPDSARHMDLSSCEILPAPPEPADRLVRAQVSSRRGLTIHVRVLIEPDPLPAEDVPARLLSVLQEAALPYGAPILLSIFSLNGDSPGVGLESATLSSLLNIEFIRAYYTAWCLSSSSADSHLQRPEPLAWALAPYMHSPTRTQPELFAAARDRALAAELPDDLRGALLSFLPPDVR
ncbi:MAG TPA: hypothetical protein DD490_05020 [Acidobacteria bacterium]|nr:hypothetical protein [Acidobacteriota bacterium]